MDREQPRKTRVRALKLLRLRLVTIMQPGDEAELDPTLAERLVNAGLAERIRAPRETGAAALAGAPAEAPAPAPARRRGSRAIP